MRILVITNLFPPAFLGGYELGCAQMVDALKAAGHDVCVITSHSDQEGGDERLRRTLELAPIYNAPLAGVLAPSARQQLSVKSSWINQGNLHVLADLIADYKPDVAYLWNLLGLGGLGILGLLKHLGVPWVWHIMDNIPVQLCGLDGGALPQIAREFVELGDGTYIVCSIHVLNEINACGVDLGARTHLLPNWVTHDGEPRRSEFYPGGSIRLVNAVGVFGEHKGTDILIDTAARLLDLGYGSFTLDMYGHQPSASFRAKLHDREVADVVRFCGPRSQGELLSLYSNYDLFVFPTWAREPFGFAPLEAASFGCVPLFSADCGIAEWLVNDVHCMKAERSVDAFAQRIIEVVRGGVDIGAIGRRAQAVVCSDFHISGIAARVETILRDAADRASAPRGPAEQFHKLATLASGLIPALLAESAA